MSLYDRVLSRAALPGAPRTVPAWPKGVAASLRRQERGEEPDAPLHRFASLAPLRREDEDGPTPPMHDQDGDDEARALRPEAEEDEVPTVHRADPEDESRALRREEEEGDELRTVVRAEADEEARALRREQEHEDVVEARRRADEEERAGEGEDVRTLRREEEEDAVRSVHRADAADPWGSAPVEHVAGSDDALQDEPPDLRALRRDAGMAIAGSDALAAPDPFSGAGGAFAGPFAPAPFDPIAFDPSGPAAFPPAPPPAERPRVTIDQIDVRIYDAAPARSDSSPSLNDLSRRIRSRYLRRL